MRSTKNSGQPAVGRGQWRGRVARYGTVPFLILAGFWLWKAVSGAAGPLPTYITFYPVVMLSAVLWGFYAGIWATLLAALVAGVWLIAPMGEWRVEKSADAVGLVLFVAMGTFMSAVAALYRRERRRSIALERDLALRQAEERLHLAIKAANAGVWEWDLRTNENTWSEELWGMYGLEPRSCPPSFDAWARTIVPEDRERIVKEVQEKAGRSQDLQVEWRVRHLDGAVRWLESRGRPETGADGAPTRYIGIVVDVTEQRLAEERVRDEKERLEVTLRSIGDAVIATDEASRVVLMNPVAERLTGWSAADAVGQPLREVFRIVAEDTHVPAADPTERVLREGVVVGLANHTVLIARDGTERPIADTGAPIRHADGHVSGAVLVFRDRTEERRAEITRVRLADIVESSDDAILSRDLEGTILTWNPAAERLLGYRAEEIIGQPVDVIVPLGQRDEEAQIFARILAGHRVDHFETQRVAKDGTLVFVSIFASPIRAHDGRIVGSSTVLRDATERQRSAEALRRSETRFRALIEKSTDLIIVVDEHERCGFWSPGTSEGLGFTGEEMQGRPVMDLVHPDDRQRLSELLTGLRSHPGELGRIQLRLKKKASSWCTVELVARNLLAEPAVQGIVLNGLDVTERRSLELQFQQSQRLESVGLLAGGVAHDLNNILSVILSGTELAQTSLKEGDPLRENLREIEQAGQRAAALTRQLLAFSRKQVLQPEALDLNQVLSEMERMLRRVLGEDVDLVVSPAKELGTVMADPAQIEQVIMNLTVNARDAMPEGGKLTIETANVQLDEEYAAHHQGAKAGPHVMIAVSDSGIGMDESTMARIFEPFFTSKGPGKGSGLGLSTVYGIVKQSGGTIYVYSEPGRGATFKVYLPRVSHEPARRSAPVSRRTVAGKETILVVEDDSSVRSIARRILEGAGYTVLVAASGAEGIALCENHPSPLHLILTDVVMPQMSGRALADRAVGLRPGLPVLFMSGYTSDAIVHNGVLEEGTQFIAKPLTTIELLARVREVLDGSRAGSGATRSELAVLSAPPAPTPPPATLPPELVAEIVDAARAARNDDILSIVERLSAKEPGLAGRLHELAEGFDYEAIVSLVRH